MSSNDEIVFRGRPIFSSLRELGRAMRDADHARRLKRSTASVGSVGATSTSRDTRFWEAVEKVDLIAHHDH